MAATVVVIEGVGRRSWSWSYVVDVATILAPDSAGILWVEKGGSATIADHMGLVGACKIDEGRVRRAGEGGDVREIVCVVRGGLETTGVKFSICI